VRHRPVRVWFKPWKKRCACGCAWYPCPDSTKVNAEPPLSLLALMAEDPSAGIQQVVPGVYIGLKAP
jgi:hypothetical protein